MSEVEIRLGTRIMVGIPTTSDSPRSPGWIDGMSGLQMPLGSSGGRKWTLDEPIDQARNSLCKMAIEIGAQYLFFLGDDVIPPGNTVLAMLDKIGREFPTRSAGTQRASMITGVYWTKTYPPDPYIFRLGDLEAVEGRPSKPFLDGAYKDWKAGEFFDIDIAGVDCLMLEVEMLKQIPEPWFSRDWIWEEGHAPSPIATEDYYFYTKAREHGFYLFADTAIQCMHEDRNTGAWYGLMQEMPQVNGVPAVGDDEVLCADLGSGLATPGELMGKKAKIIRFDMQEAVKPDVRCDIRDIPAQYHGKFDWVVASHTLEHFRRSEALSIAKHWVELLKPGGHIIIHVPNMEHAVQYAINPPETATDQDKHYAWAQIYGDQAKPGAPWQHLNGFTKRKLEGLLANIPGLTEIKIEEEHGGLNLKGTALLAAKPEPYTLTTKWVKIRKDESPQNGSSDVGSQAPENGSGSADEVKEALAEVADTV